MPKETVSIGLLQDTFRHHIGVAFLALLTDGVFAIKQLVEHFFRARIMEVNGDTTGVIHFLTFVTDTCAGSLFEVCQYFFDCFVFVLLAEGIFCSEDRCWN